MRKYKIHSQEDSQEEINITPMIDVVFIMLIFFIVTSSFVKESGVEVNRPSATSALRQERGNIVVAIRENEEVWIDNRPVDIRAVRANIQRMRAANPQGTVIIAADKAASTGVLVRVMDQIRLAGVKDISIAAKELGI